MPATRTGIPRRRARRQRMLAGTATDRRGAGSAAGRPGTSGFVPAPVPPPPPGAGGGDVVARSRNVAVYVVSTAGVEIVWVRAPPSDHDTKS